MKKWWSYIWPITRKVQSKVSGTVEVTLINGHKIVDSEHANYSYGLLQKVLNHGLAQMDLGGVGSVLLLGLGGGSVIQSLRNKYACKALITAVELDEVMMGIASEEFDIRNSPLLDILCRDAYTYVMECSHRYDLIIVDVFIDSTVPEKFYSAPFWHSLAGLLGPSGKVLFNAGVELEDDSRVREVVHHCVPFLTWRVLPRVRGANTLLIGQREE